MYERDLLTHRPRGHTTYTVAVITGAHFLLYTTNAAADRGFFRDVLGFHAVDAGEGWLIMALPPAELGVHPGDGNFAQAHGGRALLGAVLYLMCDDLARTIGELAAKGVQCTEVDEAPWAGNRPSRSLAEARSACISHCTRRPYDPGRTVSFRIVRRRGGRGDATRGDRLSPPEARTLPK